MQAFVNNHLQEKKVFRKEITVKLFGPIFPSSLLMSFHMLLQLTWQ